MRDRTRRVVPAKAATRSRWRGSLRSICPGAFAGSAKINLGNVKIPIDIIPTLRHILLVLFQGGALLEAILHQTERELAGPGAPERSTARWLVERWEALRLALGARGALPREVGPLIRLQGVPNATPL